MAKQTVTNYQSKFRLQTQALLAFFKCLDIVQVIVVSCRLKEICSWRVSELFPAVSLSIKQPETLFIFLVKPSQAELVTAAKLSAHQQGIFILQTYCINLMRFNRNYFTYQSNLQIFTDPRACFLLFPTLCKTKVSSSGSQALLHQLSPRCCCEMFSVRG